MALPAVLKKETMSDKDGSQYILNTEYINKWLQPKGLMKEFLQGWQMQIFCDLHPQPSL